jgi:very-short-patch-repair endonuclease
MLPDLATVVARTGGPFTFADALAAGYRPAAIRSLVARGQWVRLRHGVYVERLLLDFCAGDPQRRHALDVAAGILVVGGDAHASHESAAFLHGLATVASRNPHLCLTRSRVSGGTGGALRNCRIAAAELPNHHRARRHDAPVTSVARTIVDLARSRSFREGVVAADSALHGRLTTRAQLHAMLIDCATWPGIRRAGRVVEFAEPKAESPAESIGRVVCREHGLPAPRVQVVINDGAFDVARVDLYWPEHATVLEIDGLMKYGGRDHDPLVHEKLRQERLEELGLQVVRATWRQLIDQPGQVADRIRRAFRVAATRPPPKVWMEVDQLDP